MTKLTINLTRLGEIAAIIVIMALLVLCVGLCTARGQPSPTPTIPIFCDLIAENSLLGGNIYRCIQIGPYNTRRDLGIIWIPPTPTK